MSKNGKFHHFNTIINIGKIKAFGITVISIRRWFVVFHLFLVSFLFFNSNFVLLCSFLAGDGLEFNREKLGLVLAYERDEEAL